MKKIYSILFFAFFVSSNLAVAQQSFCIGSTKNYSVDLADGASGTTGSTYSWNVEESTFEGVISGNPTLNGNAVTIDWATTPPGDYTLKVIETNSDGCVGTAVTLTITINGLPTITGNDTACADATIQLTGSGTANSTNPWTSSDTSVATVSSSGLVTAVAAGTTTITYTNSNGCSITKSITINALPTISGNSSACAGATLQLTGSGTANSTNPWTSSDTSVATVSSTGLVTAVAAGTTTITYTNSNGCSITKSITINALPITSAINFN